MQQRVAIARALVSRPQVLLLDEPFASVDALTRTELQDLLLRIHTGVEHGATTIVHVTHDIDEAVYLADRVLVMGSAPGHVVAAIDVPIAAAARPDRDAELRRLSLHPQPHPPDRPSEGGSTMTAVDSKRLGAVLVLLAALVAASTAGARPVARSRNQSTVTIGYLLVEPAMQAAYAQARGYFAAQGIDAELKPFADPSLIPRRCYLGRCDVLLVQRRRDRHTSNRSALP